MIMRGLMLVLLMVLVVGVEAQDEYRLRVPTAEEYVVAIPEIIELARSEDTEDYRLLRAMITEMDYRYGEQLSDVGAEVLHNTYSWFVENDFRGIDRGLWNRAILIAWMRENEIDLSQVSHLSAEAYGFEIDVIPQDFNADGEDEYILDVNPQGTMYREMLVFRRDYEQIKTPLSWYSRVAPHWLREAGNIQTLRFEDLNHDGLIEWVLREWGFGANYQSVEQLFVLGWRNGEIVDLSPTRGKYPPFRSSDLLMHSENIANTGQLDYVQWAFVNVDEDLALEITQRQEYRDNWLCILWETRTFDWSESADRYVIDGRKYEYSDSAGCALRFAQDAMWENDPAAAIPLFERSIQLAEIDLEQVGSWPNAELIDKVTYAKARLALAYAMVGRNEDAATLLGEPLPEKDTDSVPEFMHDDTPLILIEEMLAAYSDRNLYKLCAAAYNVFDRPIESGSIASYYGWTYNVPAIGPNNGESPHSNPAKAGCDLPSMLKAARWRSITGNESPVDYLTSLGMPVAQHLMFDLNDDGWDEWLVWLDLPKQYGMFFYKNCEDCGYGVFETAIPQPDEHVAIAPHDLPDDTTALAVIFFDSTLTYGGNEYWSQDFDYYECTGERKANSGRGYLRLYHLRNQSLAEFFETAMCEQRTIGEFFSEDARELYGWAFAYRHIDNSVPYAAPSVFTWSEDESNYIQSSVEIPPTPTPYTDEITIEGDFQPELDAVERAIQTFQAGDVKTAITILDTALENPREDAELDFLNLLRFYHGLFREMNGDVEVALAEYVAIYESTPESAWGKLAALHLEQGE